MQWKGARIWVRLPEDAVPVREALERLRDTRSSWTNKQWRAAVREWKLGPGRRRSSTRIMLQLLVACAFNA